MNKSYQHLLSDRFEQDALQDIDQLLSKELEKPPEKRDYTLIQELISVYSSFSGWDEQIDHAAEREIPLLERKLYERKIFRITRKFKLLVTVACTGAVMLLANITTVSAFDETFISFMVNMTDGGFSLDYFHQVQEEDIISLPTSEDDPYGMIAECAKYDLHPETPHYLPEDYVLTECEYTEEPPYTKCPQFTFRNRFHESQSVLIMFALYPDEESMSETFFLNDKNHITHMEINGKAAILAKGNHYFQFVYPVDQLMIYILAQNISQEEVNAMIASIH